MTAVGDMIFNEKISELPEPERRNLFRIMQEADVAYGNLEFSINDRPELQRPFYNFRARREFALGGGRHRDQPREHGEQPRPRLRAGRPAGLPAARSTRRGSRTRAPARRSRAAHAPGTKKVQSQKTQVRAPVVHALLDGQVPLRRPVRALPRDHRTRPRSSSRSRDGRVETVEGPLEDDVKAMEDDVVLAKRRNDVVMVSLHVHDVSHIAAYGIQDTTPPNDEIMFRRAIDAGADIVLGSGPHVLRGIEIYKGKPIFYSLGDFIYQYRTPNKIPVDLIHQRDSEMRAAGERLGLGPPGPARSHGERAGADDGQPGEAQADRADPRDDRRRGAALRRPAAGGRRSAAKEILELLQKLSAPYGTKIVSQGLVRRDRDVARSERCC